MTCCVERNLIETVQGLVCDMCGICDTQVHFGAHVFKTTDKQHHSYTVQNPEDQNKAMPLGTMIYGKKRQYNHASNEQIQNWMNRLTLENKLAFYNVSEKFISETLVEFNQINRTSFDPKKRKNSFKGRKKEGLIAVCLFMTFRRNHVERSMQAICEMTGVRKCDFSRSLKQYLEIKCKLENLTNYTSMIVCNENQLCESICNKFDLSFKSAKIIYALYKAYNSLKCSYRHTTMTKMYAMVYYFCLESGNNAVYSLDELHFVLGEQTDVALSTIDKVLVEIKVNKLVFLKTFNKTVF